MRLLCVMAFSATFVIPPVVASTLIIHCDDPRGYEIIHGPSSISSDSPKQIEGQAEKFGSTPVFVIMDENPDEALVLWGSYIHPDLDKKIIDDLNLSAKAETASIIRRTAHQITAIQKYDGGVYMYTLYKKLGYGVFTNHSTLTDGRVWGWIYFGECRFVTD